MPVGVDDFKELRENYYLVDKTDFIRQLLDGHSKVTLITRPRRFGKTLTMSMLDYFFSLEKEDMTQHLFDGLAIDRSGAEYKARRGSSPTIFLTLRSVKKLDFAGMLETLRFVIKDLYDAHREALHEAMVDPSDKDYIEHILLRQATQEELEQSLIQLCKFLYQAFARPVVLLLDEYDVPLQQSWESGYYDEGIAFMKNFLGNALKGNPYLDFAIITGVLRVGKESIFSDLNNLRVCSVLSEKYADVFGFTFDEVKKMTEDMGRPELLPILKDWYDGYHFGSREIYNPWSVINFFDEGGEPQAYWVHTSSNGILREMLSHARSKRLQEMKLLLEGGMVNARIDDRIAYEELPRSDNALYTLLLTTGYLTVAEKERVAAASRYTLRLPNKELQSVFATEIMDHMAKGITASEFDTLLDSMLAGQTEEFEYWLQQILVCIVSTFDMANKESFYHGLMLGLVAMLTDNKAYRVESNRESGHGRFDLALIPSDKVNVGVIMELKVADTPEDMEAKAQEALAQIKKKAYTTELTQVGVKDIWCYGISFCGKKVYIVRR